MQESTTCLLVTVLLKASPWSLLLGTIVERELGLQNLGVYTNIIADYQVITDRDSH